MLFSQMHRIIVMDRETLSLLIVVNVYRKMLYTFPNIDTTEPLWPVFGTYNPYSVHVELTLKTGRDIVSIPDMLRPVSGILSFSLIILLPEPNNFKKKACANKSTPS